MDQHQPRLNEIVSQALRCQTAAERAEYLSTACGDDPQLRARVERLLEAYPQVEDFLEAPAAVLATSEDTPPLELCGAQIGPYKLLRQIGEGGMGVVYLAEQASRSSAASP